MSLSTYVRNIGPIKPFPHLCIRLKLLPNCFRWAIGVILCLMISKEYHNMPPSLKKNAFNSFPNAIVHGGVFFFGLSSWVYLNLRFCALGIYFFQTSNRARIDRRISAWLNLLGDKWATQEIWKVLHQEPNSIYDSHLFDCDDSNALSTLVKETA